MNLSIGIAASVMILMLPRADSSAETRDRLVVGRLDHAQEVIRAEQRVLARDAHAQLLDLLVDVADAGGVLLDRLRPFVGEGAQHDVRRHSDLLATPT